MWSSSGGTSEVCGVGAGAAPSLPGVEFGAVHTLRYVTELLEKKEASLANLRGLLCPVLLNVSYSSGVLLSSTSRTRRSSSSWVNGFWMKLGCDRSASLPSPMSG